LHARANRRSDFGDKATGDDTNAKKNTGQVKVCTFDTNNEDWGLVANDIIGESEDGGSGFAVAIPKGGTHVATEAIYRDGNKW